MASWINQTLHVSDQAEIVLCGDKVVIQVANNQGWDGGANFVPKDWDDAARMALSLRLAAKHIEEIGKGLK